MKIVFGAYLHEKYIDSRKTKAEMTRCTSYLI